VHVALDLRYMSNGMSEFVGYIDDQPDRPVDDGYRVFSFDEFTELRDVGVLVPVYEPSGRRQVYERLAEHGIPIVGARGLPHLVHPEAELGEGSIVTSSTRVGPRTTLGRGSLVLADLVAHDVELGEFVTLGPNSVVLGHVKIENDAIIGARATIRNGSPERPLVIGAGAMIGAGAVITRDVPPGEVMVGPPALPLAEWKALMQASRRASE